MRRHTPLAACALLLVPACSPRDETPPPDPHQHHHHAPPEAKEPVDAKHAELLEIARGLRESRDPYYGELSYRELQGEDTITMPPPQRAGHDFALAFEHFKFGKTAEAEQLAMQSFEEGGDPMSLYLAGIAALRLGEESNCLAGHNGESCILPLAGGGIHRDPEGARRAITALTEAVALLPSQFKGSARFLLNLAHMANGDWPDGVPERHRLGPEVYTSPGAVRRLRDRAPEAGMNAMNHAGGSAMDDFDGDGFLDVVTSTSLPTGPMHYYRNRGDGTFEDRTEAVGLSGQVGGLNLVHADYDGDGRLDVLVLRGGWLLEHGCQPRSLLRNLGDRFVDVTVEAGLDGGRYPSQTAAFADYDLDGDLDVFIGNEAVIRSEWKYEAVGFELPVGGDLPYASQLYRNEGGGKFVDVAAEAGVTNLRFAKGCAWGDYDGDRDPDLYVSNQWGENRLYRNDGGRFVDVAPELGVTEPLYSFPTWFWDYDNDGRLDLFCASYRATPSQTFRSYLRVEGAPVLDALYRNEGGSFRDVSAEAGLTRSAATMGANFGDVDGDGWLDFYLGTGSPRFDSLVPNVLYRSDGKGRFVDETFSSGLGQLQKGHGISFGDVDNDGDEDILLESGGFYVYDSFFNSLFENPGHGNRWITLVLEGVDSNRFGFGTRIRVTVEEQGRSRDIYRWVGAAGSFGSSSVQQEIGLGRAERIARVEVWWPKTDTVQVFEDLPMERVYRVREHATEAEPISRKTFAWP
ncbi:MAG: CRTAC1 family protein [Candidatus Eiseniibacteriota bacterium]